MNELLFATRRLLQYPQQLAAGLVAFILGIGLNTAMYSIAGGPLDLQTPNNRLAILDFSSKGLESGIRISRGTGPEFVSASCLSLSCFDLPGSTILLGRGFLPGEDPGGKNRVADLPHGLWARSYSSGPRVIGRQIRLNNEDHEIAGVAKQTPRFPSYMDVVSPYPRTPAFGQKRTDFIPARRAIQMDPATALRHD
jgi:hypothetical protein